MVLPAIPAVYVVCIALSAALAVFRLSKIQSARQLSEILNDARKKMKVKVQKGELDRDSYNEFCDATYEIEDRMQTKDKEAIEAIRLVIDRFNIVNNINPLSILDLDLGKLLLKRLSMIETLGLLLFTMILIPMCIGILVLVGMLVALYQGIRDAIKGEAGEEQKEDSNDINEINEMIRKLKRMKKAKNKNKKGTTNKSANE